MAIILPIISKRGRLNFQQFDGEYLARLCDGDREVGDHFTAYFGQLILIKLRRRVRSGQDIEDVRQETFMRVFRILRSGEGMRHPERLGALVNSVCNHVFFEMCRADRRYVPLPDADLLPTDELIDELVSEEQRQEVKRVLDELPERDRSLLWAVFFEEASRKGLPRRFDVDAEYVRVLLHRAKGNFRARFLAGGGSASPAAVRASWRS